MIPKIIHFCWFGKNKKSKLIKKCIKSWKRFCPDWQIIEWNEENFDVDCCDYVKQAYEAKKWAFVSDYCRFYVLNKLGGVYVDTDVEMLKPIDEFLATPFMAFEKENSVAPGLICACEKEDYLCKEMLAEYDVDQFVFEDGSLNFRTICERVTDKLVALGLKLENTLQKVGGYTIYPTEYFNPFDMNTRKITILEKTATIHHYAASWTDRKSRFRGRVYSFLYRFFGQKFADKVRNKLTGKGNTNNDE